MLASITPLGERSRGNRYSVTIGAFVAGAGLGGAAFGLLLGGLGSWLWPLPSTSLAVLAAISLAAFVVDVGLGPVSLPSTRRQVNARWLDTYRGTVYGFGFGAQLGVGPITVVTSGLTYVWMIAAFLSASPILGALIGAVFGIGRGMAALPAAWISTPAGFPRLARALTRWDLRTRVLALGSEAVVAVIAASIALG